MLSLSLGRRGTPAVAAAEQAGPAVSDHGSRPKVLVRPRLSAALDRILDLRLFMVVAPAGYGKTMLLREFALNAPAPAAFIALGPEHASLSFFVRAVVDAVSRSYPGAGRRALRLIEQAAASSDASEPLLLLIHEYLAEVAQPIIVVLDDYQVAESGLSSVQIARLVSSLLTSPRLQHVHFLVSGRELPSFSFSRLVLDGLVEGMGFEELAFTSDEVASYLELVQGENVSPAEAERYHQQTSGWPAAVTLLTMSLSRGLVPLSGPEGVRRYLDEEVMPGLPDDLKTFAIRCSALDSLSVELCDDALQSEDAYELLNELQHRSLFIQRAEDRELDPRYQFHSLWREYLAGHLPLRERRAIQTRAGRFSGQHDDWSGALRYFALAENAEELNLLLLERGTQMINAGLAPVVREAVEGVGAFTRLDPAVRVVYAETLMRASEIDRVDEVLDSLPQQDDPDVVILRARNARVAGRSDEALGLAEAQLESQGLSLEQQARLHRVAGSSAWQAGQIGRSEHHLEMALKAFTALHNHAEAAYSKSELAAVYRERGAHHHAERLYSEAARTLRSLRRVDYLPLVLNNLATILILTRRPVEALEVLGEARTIVQTTQDTHWEGDILHTSGEASRALGQLQDALETFRQSARAAHRAGFKMRAESALIWTAIVTAEMGQLVQAHRALADLQAGGLTAARTRILVLVARGRVAWLESDFPAVLEACRLGEEAAQSTEIHRFDNVLQLFRAAAFSRTLGGQAELRQTLSALASDSSLAEAVSLFPDIADSLIRNARLSSQSHLAHTPVWKEITELVRATADVLGAVPDGPLRHRIAVSALEKPLRVAVNGEPFKGRWKAGLDVFLWLVHHPEGGRVMDIGEELWPALKGGERAWQLRFHSAVAWLRHLFYPEFVIREGASRPYFFKLDPALQVDYDVRDFLQQAASVPDHRTDPTAELDAIRAAKAMRPVGYWPAHRYEGWAEEIALTVDRAYYGLLVRELALARLNDPERLEQIEAEIEELQAETGVGLRSVR